VLSYFRCASGAIERLDFLTVMRSVSGLLPYWFKKKEWI
jgi:hypothetical protein